MQTQIRQRSPAGIPRNSGKTAETMLRNGRGGVPLTPETIDRYLGHLRERGRAQGTIDSYARKLKRLYRELPKDDKVIRRETLEWWQRNLTAAGCSAAAVNQFMIAANGYLEYVGARELQLIEKLDAPSNPQPELTRSEYLRLLSAARTLGRRQAYLLVKVFGNSDLPVQELRNLTAEAVQAGRLSVSCNTSKEIIRFPDCLCQELLTYANDRGIRSGPIFLTRNGKPIDRTNVTVSIRRLCRAAQVSEEKGSPRCLRKLYQSTRAAIECNIALLVEQAQDRLLEDEQLMVGWNT